MELVGLEESLLTLGDRRRVEPSERVLLLFNVFPLDEPVEESEARLLELGPVPGYSPVEPMARWGA